MCQQTLQDLEQKLKDQSSDSADIGIPKILEHLNIEPELVGYSIEDEMFTNWRCIECVYPFQELCTDTINIQ